LIVAEAVVNDCSQGDAIITYADWDDDLSDSQRLFTFIGILADPADDPFRWQ
jgi:hypothetical protein